MVEIEYQNLDEELENDNSPKRIFVMGDIHGAYKALVQVMQRCEFNPEEDQIIFLGDYVDGWSESYEVIEYLISLKEICKHEPIFIAGNHDLMFREWLRTGKRNPIWLENGGRQTIESYIQKGGVIDQKHKDFIDDLVYYTIDLKDNVFCHAGVVKFKDLASLNIEKVTRDRTMWEKYAMCGVYNDFMKDVKNIYIGHTATINWKAKPHFPEYQDPNQKPGGDITVPMKRCNVWNVDTGAGFDGKLTIMNILTDEYWQSDFVKELYKDEKGRN